MRLSHARVSPAESTSESAERSVETVLGHFQLETFEDHYEVKSLYGRFD
jgi:hypothetical protein